MNGVNSQSLDEFLHFSEAITQRAEEESDPEINSVTYLASSPQQSSPLEDPHLKVKKIKETYERLTSQLEEMAHDNLNYFQQEFEDLKEPEQQNPLNQPSALEVNQTNDLGGPVTESIALGVRESGQMELNIETVELDKVNEIESKTGSVGSQEDINILRNSYIRQR